MSGNWDEFENDDKELAAKLLRADITDITDINEINDITTNISAEKYPNLTIDLFVDTNKAFLEGEDKIYGYYIDIKSLTEAEKQVKSLNTELSLVTDTTIPQEQKGKHLRKVADINADLKQAFNSKSSDSAIQSTLVKTLQQKVANIKPNLTWSNIASNN